MKPFEYSNIYVIESLRPNDKKTGKELFDDIIIKRMMQKNLENQCTYLEVVSKLDLYKELEKIIYDVTYKDVNPIIHLEMHGDEYGLEMTNGERISWQELQFYFLQINGICENNLFVTMATCKGGYIFKTINPSAWTPFWGFIGPHEVVSGPEILESYSIFYNEFLISGNFIDSVKSMNQSRHDKNVDFNFF